jgi:hypothetical protein
MIVAALLGQKKGLRQVFPNSDSNTIRYANESKKMQVSAVCYGSSVLCRLERVIQPHNLFKGYLYTTTNLNAPPEIALPAQVYTSGSQHIQFVQHFTTATTGLASEALLSKNLPTYLRDPQI